MKPPINLFDPTASEDILGTGKYLAGMVNELDDTSARAWDITC